MSSTFLERVKLKNYKSVGQCDVALGPLTLLVGPNGSGKSNFLDALRLVADALNHPLDHALRQRGGIDDVRRRSTGHPHNFAIELSFRTPSGWIGRYGFEVAAKGGGGFAIKREVIHAEDGLGFDVEHGEIRRCSVHPAPRAAPDRLFLVNLSGIEPFRDLFDALTSMGFYNVDPVQIRSVQAPDPGGTLARDGRNIASVVHRLSQEDPTAMNLVQEYLAKIVDGLESVARVQIANQETLEFRQDVRGSKHPWKFYANSMSDGTLRALGVLVALFQRGTGGRARVPLVGLEEPETALHPAAAGILLGALRAASRHTQVIATTHSPQLLDDEHLTADQILAVRADAGVTVVGPAKGTARDAIRKRLVTPGELLVQDQLVPEDSPTQLRLFEPVTT